MAFVLSAASLAQGTVLFYEGFNYDPGPLNGKVLDGDSTWSTPHAYHEVVSPGLTYPGLITSGNRQEKTGADSHSQRGAADLPNNAGITTMWSTPGTYYFTYLVSERAIVTLSPGPAAYGGGGFMMNSSPAGTSIWTYIMDKNRPNGQPAGDPYWYGQFYADPGMDDGVHLFAWRFVNGGVGANDELKLVIDPDLSQGEPDWSAAVRTWSGIESTFADPHNLQIVGANLAPNYGSPGYHQGGVDEFRIATTWADVIPEPMTLTALGLGALLFAGPRRRR